MPLKELKKLIALCRAQGVTSFKMDGVELQLGPLPIKQVPVRDSMPSLDPGKIPAPMFKPGDIIEQSQIDQIKTDMLEGEDLLFYSAGGPYAYGSGMQGGGMQGGNGGGMQGGGMQGGGMQGGGTQ